MFKKYVWAALTLLALLVAACGAPTPQIIEKEVIKEVEKVVTQVVKETVVVEGTPKVIEKEVTTVVEKEVTPTPTPEPDLPMESPFLAEKFASGELPPLADRLPNEPLVVRPGMLVVEEHLPDFSIGRYGGTIRTVHRGAFSAETFVTMMEPLVAAPGISLANAYGNVVQDFEVSDDAKTFTFYMREGLKWSDGELVTAQDVLFVYEDLYMNEAYGTIPAKFRSTNGTPMELTVMDDYTFKIEFDTPYGGFLRDLAISGWTGYYDILKPRHFLEAYHPTYADAAELKAKLDEAELSAEEWPTLFNQVDCTRWEVTRDACVGFPQLSPWVVVEVTEQSLTFDRNPYYFKVDELGRQLPYVDQIVSVRADNVEMVQLRAIAGDVDYLYATDYRKYPLYKENEESAHTNTINLTLHADPVALFVNTCSNDEAFVAVAGDIRFRQALSFAIDRDEINEAVFLWLGETPTLVPAEFDPDKASELLDEMGMNERDAEGMRLAPDGSKFTMITHVPADRADQMPTAELVRAHLVEVGVRMEIEQLESGLAREKGQIGDLQTAIHWVQTPLWVTGMDTNYFGYDFYCYQWRQYCLTDGEQGEAPDEAGERLCEIWKERQQVVPLSSEDEALIEELMQIHYDNMWAISIIQNIKRPTIFNQDLRNVAIDGQQMAAVRGGEIWWYDR